jgi:uncharacterized protein
LAGCSVRFAGHGGCPKDRLIPSRDGEAGLNDECDDYFAMFQHFDAPLEKWRRCCMINAPHPERLH